MQLMRKSHYDWTMVNTNLVHGPVTVEEVEDVKTVLRLLPVFLSLLSSFIVNNLVKHKNLFLTTAQNFDCVAGLQEMITIA